MIYDGSSAIHRLETIFCPTLWYVWGWESLVNGGAAQCDKTLEMRFFPMDLSFLLFWTHSVEIWEFYFRSNFSWNQFWQTESPKNGHFDNFRGCEFWFQKISDNENCQNLSKWRNHGLRNCPNGHFWDSRYAKIDFMENLSGSKILKFPHCVTRGQDNAAAVSKTEGPPTPHRGWLCRRMLS